MNKKVIKIELNTTSINKAIKELQNYKERLIKKGDELTKRLAQIGLEEAQVRFNNATIDYGDEIPKVSVEPCDNGYKVVANGSDICFIEFGTGVYYNGTEPYPIKRPPGVVGIGEYGKGMGKRKGWYFYDEKGEKHFTRGIPASMPMFYSAREIEQELLKIAREVFER